MSSVSARINSNTHICPDPYNTAVCVYVCMGLFRCDYFEMNGKNWKKSPLNVCRISMTLTAVVNTVGVAIY